MFKFHWNVEFIREKNGKITCVGADANCAGAQVDPGGAALEFLDLNIDRGVW